MAAAIPVDGLFTMKEQTMSDLVNRLLGRYPMGPIINGEPEFGWRQFDGLPPIQKEAAEEIIRLHRDLELAIAGLQEIATPFGCPLVGDWDETASEKARKYLVELECGDE